MRRVQIILMAGLALLGSNVYAGSDDDQEYRIQYGISWKFADEWKLTVAQEPHLYDDGDMYSNETDVGLAYSGLADWMEVSLNFRWIDEKDSAGTYRRENRPHFNVTIKDQFMNLNWKNRTRIEYRNRENASDFWRLRNKFTLDLPFTVPVINYTPYVADEVFFNLNERGYYRNRLYGGLSGKLGDRIKTNFYYYLQKSQSSSNWNATSVVGMELIYNF